MKAAGESAEDSNAVGMSTLCESEETNATELI